MDIKEMLPQLLVDAVDTAFSSTVSMKPVLTDDTFQDVNEECVISSLGFTGILEGNFSLTIPDKYACVIVAKMLGMEIPEITSDVFDGIGEIVNIIAGSVKMTIPDPKYHYQLSIPSAVKGNRMVILSDPNKTTRVVKHFIYQDIKFAVALIYKIHDETATPKKPPQNQKASALDMLNQLGGGTAAPTAPAQPAPEPAKKNPLDALNEALKKTNQQNL